VSGASTAFEVSHVGGRSESVDTVAVSVDTVVVFVDTIALSPASTSLGSNGTCTVLVPHPALSWSQVIHLHMFVVKTTLTSMRFKVCSKMQI
jgi:hypothetical protein